jgi:hypothetical protein
VLVSRFAGAKPTRRRAACRDSLPDRELRRRVLGAHCESVHCGGVEGGKVDSSRRRLCREAARSLPEVDLLERQAHDASEDAALGLLE